MTNITLFSQIISKLDKKSFSKFVKEKGTDKHKLEHLVSMLFCRFAKSQSVRDISNGLHFATDNLNHLGVHRTPSKSSISYQNIHRKAELFKDYYYHLYHHLGLQAKFNKVKFRIKSKIFLLDSTIISLCLNLFERAKNKTDKGELIISFLLLKT